jgi:predicted HicB family RNase H-like nuclease
MPSANKPRRRKIHIDLPEEVHQKLRVKAAMEDVSMQAFVARVVAEAVEDVVMPQLVKAKEAP